MKKKSEIKVCVPYFAICIEYDLVLQAVESDAGSSMVAMYAQMYGHELLAEL